MVALDDNTIPRIAALFFRKGGKMNFPRIGDRVEIPKSSGCLYSLAFARK